MMTSFTKVDVTAGHGIDDAQVVVTYIMSGRTAHAGGYLGASLAHRLPRQPVTLLLKKTARTDCSCLLL
ncbi:hypothetical protein P153DRAFT_369390 [Dothidotthia symphoricarpi CBS 119687]|uniref:Uncharacterized protein n=1 Tax=Dothidotthia symphoricarpi CBS 119687 TaxID=1392245 RepID=A0A6A6A389_9PLEO|nr:uncharacterized protein P153DRAFT_369390 [Dothidotthia symphoricarpi CBS 119687]KAF2126016.1 hypothetical protein P153DRAFT_369390 [Dothidotthia symphoricarpi CBS 119687]